MNIKLNITILCALLTTKQLVFFSLQKQKLNRTLPSSVDSYKKAKTGTGQ